MIISIHPDGEGTGDSASQVWADRIAAAGHVVRWVDVYRTDIITQLRGSDALMWRWNHSGQMSRVAKRLLPAVDQAVGIPVFPNWNTCWHYDDKIAQYYLLSAHGIPVPRTWVFYEREAALDFLSSAEYPLVSKLWGGAGSENVVLCRSFEEAALIVRRLFWNGVFTLKGGTNAAHVSGRRRRLAAAGRVLATGDPGLALAGRDIHGGYALFQEFLPGNDFDTRVTVIGNRAFGFRRLNRPSDFRASGSGRIDWNPESIDLRFVRLAFDVARKIGAQSCAIDGMMRDGEAVIGEISYTFVNSAVERCPGHWSENESRGDGLEWVEGSVCPAEAQLDDFLAYVEAVREQDRPVLLGRS